MAAAGVGFAGPQRLSAQTQLTPDAAVDALMAGNRRFTAGRRTADEQDLSILKQKTAEKQEPFAAVLSCADSRVPVEILFDQSIGHIFVVRVAGNIVTPEVIASLEYGVAVLGTRAIVVMGHGNCGAVKAAIQGAEVPGQISTLFQHLRAAVDQAGSNPDAVTRANAKVQSAVLRNASTVISGMVKQKKLRVAAAYYDVAAGGVTLLD
jgi:carbonic anhydrase